MIRIQAAPFDPEVELRDFVDRQSDFGAIASFAGYVRGEKGQVATLELQHYPGFTETEIEKILKMARARFEISDALVIHRYGPLGPGEAIVLVAAVSAHRKPAFEAVDFLMDYLKTDAPFWKREISPEGASNWIEPRSQDRQARLEWETTGNDHADN